MVKKQHPGAPIGNKNANGHGRPRIFKKHRTASIIFEDSEYIEYQKQAATCGLSLAEWIRKTLRNGIVK